MNKSKPKSKPLTKNKSRRGSHFRHQLPKSPTGIQGLDEITGGGLPKGRPTLVCGGAGCGKTLLAMEFLVRGATQFHEPGVFMAFEETAKDLTQNVVSLGFDLKDLIARNRILLDFVHVERGEIEETGEYDLEGLFIRLGHAIDSIGAKSVVLDTIESLFAGLPNPLSETGFDLKPADMGRYLGQFAQDGLINIAGGCCGNTPEHIAALAEAFGQSAGSPERAL